MAKRDHLTDDCTHIVDLPGDAKTKTIYCAGCLEHFGATTCPMIRGVAAYKKSKNVASILALK